MAVKMITAFENKNELQNYNVHLVLFAYKIPTTNITCHRKIPKLYMMIQNRHYCTPFIHYAISCYRVCFLSNRPQVSMVYKLINHAGCWQNTRRICKPQAAGEWFTNCSSVLPTSQVVYQPITHRKLVVYCFYIIIQKTRNFSVGILAQKTTAD